MSQAQQILEHIKAHGNITPAEAYEHYGCLALHSRAAELREMNYPIKCTIKTNGRKKWGSYTLEAA